MTRFVSRFVAAFVFVVTFLVPSIAGAVESDVRVAFVKVVFDQGGVAQGKIFVRNITDGSERQITPSALNAQGPSWSPDGTKIGFIVEVTLPNGQLSNTVHLVKLMTGELLSLDIEGWSVRVSDNLVTFTFLKGNSSWVGIARQDGTARFDVAPGRMSSFSPDGSELVFVNLSGGIDVMRVDGSGRRNVTTDIASLSTPVFVDQDRVVYAAYQGATGSEVVRLFVHNLQTGLRAPLGDGGTPQVVDGLVVYRADKWYVVRPDGSDLRELPFQKDVGAIHGDLTSLLGENSRPVEPRGKVPMIWADLKRQ